MFPWHPKFAFFVAKLTGLYHPHSHEIRYKKRGGSGLGVSCPYLLPYFPLSFTDTIFQMFHFWAYSEPTPITKPHKRSIKYRLFPT